MSHCEKCFNPNKEQSCGICIYNLNNVYKRDNWQPYPICCPLGFKDCIHDPGYLWCYHPENFKKIYGDVEPQSVICEYECEDGDLYDDEDK